MPMSKKPQNKPDNDNPLKKRLSIPMPEENWLDFKKRELVLLWSDGRETRYALSDARFKEYLEQGCPLKNL